MFSRAIIRNDHKCVVLKQQKFILYRLTSEIQEWLCDPDGALRSSAGCTGGSFLPLSASGGSRRPWAVAVTPSASVSMWLFLCVCSLLKRTPVTLDQNCPNVLPLIISVKILFPNRLLSQVSGCQHIFLGNTDQPIGKDELFKSHRELDHLHPWQDFSGFYAIWGDRSKTF